MINNVGGFRHNKLTYVSILHALTKVIKYHAV